MRLALISLLFAFLLWLPARAAQGYKGRVSTSITLGPDFLKAADPLGRLGLDLSSFTIPPVTGMIYICGSSLRLDMTVPGGTVTTLYRDGQAYLLDHHKKVAWRSPVAGQQEGMPLLNPEQFASGWDQFSPELQGLEGMKIRQLGNKPVNGQLCKGIRVRGDIRKLLDADEVEVAVGLPSLYNVRGDWQGTFWVSEKAGLPMKITSSFSGISLVWQIAGLASGDIPDAMFAVPPGYRVEDSKPLAQTGQL